MSLDDKLGPISRRLGPIGRAYHRIDDEVHRYYERIVKRWEDDGHERDTLEFASFVAMLGAITLTNIGCEVLGSVKERNLTTNEEIAHLTSAAYCALQALMTSLNFELDKKRTIDGTTQSYTGYDFAVQISPAFGKLRNGIRSLRLLSLATGAGAIVNGGIHLIEGYKIHDPLLMDYARTSINFGLLLLGAASADYIRDHEPSLLDKAPAWKRALDSVKEYFAPTPTTAPAQNYLTANVNQ